VESRVTGGFSVAENETTPTQEGVNEILEPVADAETTVNTDNVETPKTVPEADGVEIKMAEVQAKANEYLEGWQRTRAEFANYKKRTDKEMRESHQRGTHDALAKILPLLDDFERALGNLPDELKDHAWVSGVTMLQRKFEKLLQEYNVEVIDPVGESFDPNKHEAIGMEPSDEHESGHVTVTLQKGYASGERVLRPALVKVAS
jgi:molecular chaperone GrpE